MSLTRRESRCCLMGSEKIPSLKLTAKAPENGWLEDDCFLLGRFGRFSGAFAVSFRECSQDEICSNLDTNVECLKMMYTRNCQSTRVFWLIMIVVYDGS